MRMILHTESSLGLGGQEMRIVTEARWLLANGWAGLIACQPESRLLVEARAAGLPVAIVTMRGPLDLRAMAALGRLMKEHRVALVHTHSSIDSWVATLAAKALSLPVVRSRHVSIPIPRRRALVYRLADRASRAARPLRRWSGRQGCGRGESSQSRRGWTRAAFTRESPARPCARSWASGDRSPASSP